MPLVELRRHDTDEATAELRLPPVADLGNVVPFRRPHARLAEHPTPAEIVTPTERLIPAPRRDRRRVLLFALLVASVALHVVLLAVLSRAPPPLPGIELAPITVEIIVSDGARPDAGAGATTPNEEPKGQQQPQQEPRTVIQPTAPETEAKPPEESPPQVSEPERAQTSEPPATPPEAPVTDTMPPEDKTPAPPEFARQPPVAEQPRPTEAAPPRPEPSAPTQPREQTEKSPTEPKAAPPPPPKQKPAQSAEPSRLKQAPARENGRRPPEQATSRTDGKARAKETGTKPSTAAPSARSTSDPNYAGTVLAQLARHKRMPAEAQRNHSQGMATINFMIDGSGRVGAVRLVRSSGVAILDQEALGLPRRASPFPPPPGGRAQPITVPVNFRF
jgi:periplasmic protein TonB